MKKIRNLRWYVLALLILGTMVNYIDRNTLGALSPILKKEMNITNEEYSFIVSAFQLCYSLMQPIAGYLTDFLGPRLGYCVFAFVWGTAAALHAFAGSWQQFSLFRGLLGISEAAAMPTGVKTSTLWFPAKERSMATGWFNSGTSVGAMLATPLAVWLATTWDWRVAFLSTGLLGIILSGVWYKLYRDPEHASRLTDEERAYILGDQVDEPKGKPSFKAIVGNRKFYAIVIARFLTEPAWQTLGFWIPIYMVSERGMDIKQFALFAWLPFLGADLGCIAGGYLAPFFHKYCKMTLVNSRIAGIGVGAVCMIGPAMVGLASNPFVAIFCFSLGGFAHQMVSSLMYAVVTDTFDKKDVATATGFGGMFGYLGGMSFTLLIGQKATAWGFEPLFASLVGFDIVAFLVIALVIGERKRKSTTPALASAE